MPTDLVGKKMAVSVLFDTVSIEIICGDDYLAQVLYDDIIDRMQNGKGIQLGLATEGASVSDRPKCPICDGIGSHQWNCTLNK